MVMTARSVVQSEPIVVASEYILILHLITHLDENKRSSSRTGAGDTQLVALNKACIVHVSYSLFISLKFRGKHTPGSTPF